MRANFDDFGVKDWDLVLNSKILGPALEQLIEEVLREILGSDDCTLEPDLSFPIEWHPDGDGIGHEPVTDPLTVYVNFPALSTKADVGPFLIFNLREALIEGIENLVDGDGSHRPGLTLLPDALRKFADEIDEALTKGEAAKP